MKRLFLASEAKHPKSYAKLQEFVGRLSGKKIAYIPTAANGEEPYGSWKKGATWKLINKSGAKITPVVLEDHKGPSAVKLLENKDIIWFAGGMCGYLMYWVRRCQIDKHLNRLLESGTVYVGSSAGCMSCAKTLDIAEAYLDGPEAGVAIIPGLGLIDFDFYPHYEDEMLSEIKRVWKGGDLYLMKNGEAIIIEGKKMEIFGEKRILRNGKLITE